MNTATHLQTGTLAALLDEPADTALRAGWRRLARQAVLPITVVAAALAAWSAAAPLAGAVVAPAQIKVELNRKTVQHQEGGIVREILVREGQRVRAGEALMVVGDVRTDAELELQRDAHRAALARRARAASESAMSATMAVPPELQGAEAAEHVARER